jgi:hypothetical protein
MRSWQWLAEIENSWTFSNEDKITDSNLEAVDEVFARFGVWWN